ncbi:MAG: hypothetical protein GY764_12280 [Halieaceae bacterium]|nr:hypothetical protein [Halieaceae bacterium]
MKGLLLMKNGSTKSNQVKERMPVHHRVAVPPKMEITDRDRQIIQAVWRYRLLRRDQIQTLFFPSRNTTNRRLQHLYQHGFLQRILPPVRMGEGSPQAIYALDRQGIELIALEQGIPPSKVLWNKKEAQASLLFLQHTLHLNDVRIAMTQATQQHGHKIMCWLDEREIIKMRERVPAPGKRRRHLPVTPDAFFEYKICEKRNGFFLEMDMGTMALRRFKDKVRAYRIYKRDGHYEKRFGMHSLRILTVTTSMRRLRNLKKATEQADGRSLFWFTTTEKLAGDWLHEPIWFVAGKENTASLFRITAKP